MPFILFPDEQPGLSSPNLQDVTEVKAPALETISKTRRIESADGNTFFDLDNDLLQIADDSNVTVIDAKGLVSTATFSADSTIGSSTQSITGTSYADITGLTVSFTLARAQNVLLFATATGLVSTGDSTGVLTFRALIDAAQMGATIVTPGRYFSSDLSHVASTGSTQEIVQLAAGSHTLKLQAKINTGGVTGTAWRDSCIVGYVVLGK